MTLEKSSPTFHFVGTMTDMPHSKKKWDGKVGLIDKAMLSRYVGDLRGPIYYIAGPPAMVTDLRKMLVASTIDEDDLRTDEFAGY